MARVKLLEINEVEAEAREMFQKSIEATGGVINLFKALAHSPKICRDWNRFGTSLLRKGVLSKKLQELSIIRVGHLCQAPYELTAHNRIGLEAGLTKDQISSIADWKNSKYFDEVEQAILQYTDEVSLNIRVSDETYDRIARDFSQREIVELTVTIGFYGMVCRVLEPLQVDMEKAPRG